MVQSLPPRVIRRTVMVPDDQQPVAVVFDLMEIVRGPVGTVLVTVGRLSSNCCAWTNVLRTRIERAAHGLHQGIVGRRWGQEQVTIWSVGNEALAIPPDMAGAR